MELRMRDVEKLFAASEKKINQWIDDKKMPVHDIGGQLRFNRAELLEWATAHQIPLSGRIFGEPANGETPMTGFAEALTAGGIFHNVGGNDRESVLRAIVATMPLPEDADREMLIDVLIAREALGSTGVGDGIAIPHVRSPVVVHVPKAMISLCFLASPIDFDAVDGKPVNAMFSFISPTVRVHLHLLSRLAFALQDEKFKAAVLRQSPAEEILAEARRVEIALAQKATPGK